jgi:PAS domain S-box-containing protein
VDYPSYFALLRNSRIIDVSSVGDDEGFTPYWGTQLIPTEVGAFLDSPVRRRGGVVGVLRIQHFDGDREWRPPEMSFVGSLADLVTQTLEIAELVERERELAEAQEIAHLGSWSWDLKARVHWSDETFRILGHAPGSVEPSIQRYLDQVAPPERAALASRIDDCSETGRPFSMNHRIIRPSGEERFVNCYGTLVRDAHAKRIRLGGTCLDITELALAKKAAAASKAAEDANVALIRSRSALRETLSNLAHDIRTPLASLKLALGRLLQPEGDFEEVASALRSEVEYLDGLITNLVSLVQIEGDTVQLSYRPSDLAILLERVQLRFQWLAADEGAVVEVALPGEPVIVSLDPLAMEQAVGNLVHNAVKYAEKHVALLLYVERGEAVIIVHDDGPAPPPETADGPSRQFNRGGEASGGRPGLSLGLNITDELVRRHGGLFTIDAHPVSGSRAEIRLPLDG